MLADNVSNFADGHGGDYHVKRCEERILGGFQPRNGLLPADVWEIIQEFVQGITRAQDLHVTSVASAAQWSTPR